MPHADKPEGQSLRTRCGRVDSNPAHWEACAGHQNIGGIERNAA